MKKICPQKLETADKEEGVNNIFEPRVYGGSTKYLGSGPPSFLRLIRLPPAVQGQSYWIRTGNGGTLYGVLFLQNTSKIKVRRTEVGQKGLSRGA